jgi:hypothetical protein
MKAPSIFKTERLGVPVRFSPSVERLEPDEAKTIQGLIATMRYVNEKTFADGGHAIRSVHAKTQGILEGYLEVDKDLPFELAQGLFAKPGRYPVVMRFSTVPGDILDDSVSTPRGLSVKIIGVEGERLSGSEGDVTQDFLLVNGPATRQENSVRSYASVTARDRRRDRAPKCDGGNPWRTTGNPYSGRNLLQSSAGTLRQFHCEDFCSSDLSGAQCPQAIAAECERSAEWPSGSSRNFFQE